MCPRSNDKFDNVTYYTKWLPTSWTYSILNFMNCHLPLGLWYAVSATPLWAGLPVMPASSQYFFFCRLNSSFCFADSYWSTMLRVSELVSNNYPRYAAKKVRFLVARPLWPLELSGHIFLGFFFRA